MKLFLSQREKKKRISRKVMEEKTKAQSGNTVYPIGPPGM